MPKQFHLPFYNLDALGNNIFLVTEKSPLYLVGNLFLRYQEYFESPNPAFRGHMFTLQDYHQWFHTQAAQSYIQIFKGFGLASAQIAAVLNNNIPDRNKYDIIMQSIYKLLDPLTQGDFYVVSYTEGWSWVLRHEVAHALWELNPEYREEMTSCLQILTPEQRQQLDHILAANLYAANVFDTEIQAYLSEPGTTNCLGRTRISGLTEKSKAFQAVFLKFAPDFLKPDQ
jgi:hypothetical protein